MERRVERRWVTLTALGLITLSLIAAACGPAAPRHPIDLNQDRTAICYTLQTPTVVQDRCYLTPQTQRTLAGRPDLMPTVADYVTGETAAGYSPADPWGCAQATSQRPENKATLNLPGDGTSRISNLNLGLLIPLDNPACRSESSPATGPLLPPPPIKERPPEGPTDPAKEPEAGFPWWGCGGSTIAALALGGWIALRGRGTAHRTSPTAPPTSDMSVPEAVGWGMSGETLPDRASLSQASSHDDGWARWEENERVLNNLGYTRIRQAARRAAMEPHSTRDAATGEPRMFVPASDWVQPDDPDGPARTRLAEFRLRQALDQRGPDTDPNWRRTAPAHEGDHLKAAGEMGAPARTGTLHEVNYDVHGRPVPGRLTAAAIDHTDSSPSGQWHIATAPDRSGRQMSEGDLAIARRAMNEMSRL